MTPSTTDLRKGLIMKNRYFSYTPHKNVQHHATAKEAMQCVNEHASICRDDALRDGDWPQDVEDAYWGEIKGVVAEVSVDADHSDFQLKHLPEMTTMTRCEQIDSEANALQKVLQEVAAERIRQDEKWGGPATDDQWTALDWHEMIADYNGWARRMAATGRIDKARSRYMHIASLAIAAVEAIDRRAHGQTIAPY